ncbi:MAG TPA: Ltp family lipoprotein [Pseudonocardiaceae bacterium]|jgi:hypothetical protein
MSFDSRPPLAPVRPKRRRRWPWFTLAGLVAFIVIITVASASNSGVNPGLSSSVGGPVVTTSPVADCGNADATMVNGLCTEPPNEVTQTGVAPPPVPTTTTKTAPAVPPQEQQAIGSAQNYLAVMPFSRAGLIEQLDSSAGDGYPVDVATAAVDSLTVDWNAQAATAAQAYLNVMHFSCSGLIHQLDSSAGDKYTTAQATYGAHQTSACS